MTLFTSLKHDDFLGKGMELNACHQNQNRDYQFLHRANLNESFKLPGTSLSSFPFQKSVYRNSEKLEVYFLVYWNKSKKSLKIKYFLLF